MSPLLRDVTVVDLTRLLPGQYCARLLADLGARVVKVERPPLGDPGRYGGPEADGAAVRHLVLDRGKESELLDLASPEGRRRWGSLLDGADVVLDNFRPQALDALGLRPDETLRRHDRLVWCSLTGFGGDAAGWAGHDLNFQAEAGALSLIPGGSSMPGAQWADLLGATTAALAVVAALLGRPADAPQRRLEVACSDTVLSALSLHLVGTLAGEGPASPFAHLLGASPWYRVYRCRDGRAVAVGALEGKFRQELLAATGLTDGESLGAWFAERTQAAVLADLAAIDGCVTPVRNLTEAMEAAPPGLVRPLDADSGPLRTVACPIRVGGDYLCAPGRARALGGTGVPV